MRWHACLLGILWWNAFGCAPSVPVDCPDGFVLTANGDDCESANDPDVDPTEEPPTCAELDCDDQNECTIDDCASAACRNDPVEDGVECFFPEGDGICVEGQCVCAEGNCGPYPCTEAGIRAALEDGGDAVIGCMAPTTVTLSGSPLIIDKDGSIDGLGNLTVDAALLSRVFEIGPPAVAELVGIEITRGLSPPTEDGGGILIKSDATLTLRNCRVVGNVASDDGGGIGCGGTCQATVIDSVIDGNFANDRGGGIANSGEIAFVDSVISNNQCLDDGGGMYNTSDGIATLERTTVSENLANSLGGGIWTSGFLVTLSASMVVDNAALGGAGLRLWSGSELRAFDSLIARNVAGESGGGMTSLEGRITLERCTLSENHANDLGGAIDIESESILDASDTLFSDNTADFGGAIYSRSSTVRLKRSTLQNNTASSVGGGLRVYDRGSGAHDLAVENSTLSGNSAAERGGAIAGGSGVVMSVIHATLADNAAPLGSAIQQDSGSTCDVGHSVLYGSCAELDDALLRSLGHNGLLDLDADRCAPTGALSDQILTAEQMDLGVLTDNGGWTPTHRPGAASLLIDAIPADECVHEDQRGQSRAQVGACDVGSVEVQSD